MSQAANNQCCGSNKRCSGTAVVVCASIATISMTICALFTFDIPLYAWFGWINVIMNVTVLVTASIFVCQCCGEEGCKPHLVQGIMMAYCALAVISFIVCASGAVHKSTRGVSRPRRRRDASSTSRVRTRRTGCFAHRSGADAAIRHNCTARGVPFIFMHRRRESRR